MQVEIFILTGPSKGRTLKFNKPDCILFGRSADSRISISNDPYVSRQHFLLEICPPECKVADLDSKNGTFVNGVRFGGRKPPEPGVSQAQKWVKEIPLDDGDEITVGDTKLKISINKEIYCLNCDKKIDPEAINEAPLAYGNGMYLCEHCKPIHSHRETNEHAVETLSHIPNHPSQTIHCVQCNKDITDETDTLNHDMKIDYLCHDCNQKKRKRPLKQLRALLKSADLNIIPDAPNITGYDIEKKIGQGGMGIVFKARKKLNGQLVAIKTMRPQVAMNEENIRIFQREVEVTRQLQHDNIVNLYEHGKSGMNFFFVLEFVDGLELNKFLESKGGVVNIEEAAHIILESLKGLAHAHTAKLEMDIADGTKKMFTGIVHRDIKPQNILLTQNGDKWIPKISDFGLSKSFESAGMTNMTKADQVAGTPIYWPREQITHYKYLNPASDVFSIAAVFYETLTGKRIRQGVNKMLSQCKHQKRSPGISDYMRVLTKNPTIPIRERKTDIPKEVADVIDKALQEVEVPPDEIAMRNTLSHLRYPDAGALYEAFEKAFRKIGTL